MRITIRKITSSGRGLCDRVDAEVRPHVDYFTAQLTADERETALSTLMFYIGPEIVQQRAKRRTRQFR